MSRIISAKHQQFFELENHREHLAITWGCSTQYNTKPSLFVLKILKQFCKSDATLDQHPHPPSSQRRPSSHPELYFWTLRLLLRCSSATLGTPGLPAMPGVPGIWGRCGGVGWGWNAPVIWNFTLGGSKQTRSIHPCSGSCTQHPSSKSNTKPGQLLQVALSWHTQNPSYPSSVFIHDFFLFLEHGTAGTGVLWGHLWSGPHFQNRPFFPRYIPELKFRSSGALAWAGRAW